MTPTSSPDAETPEHVASMSLEDALQVMREVVNRDRELPGDVVAWLRQGQARKRASQLTLAVIGAPVPHDGERSLLPNEIRAVANARGELEWSFKRSAAYRVLGEERAYWLASLFGGTPGVLAFTLFVAVGVPRGRASSTREVLCPRRTW